MATPVNDFYTLPSSGPLLTGKFAVSGGGNHAPTWSLTPGATLELARGMTLDIRGYASDADGDAMTFTLDAGTLPAGVTFSNGVFTASGGATIALSGTLDVGADDGVAAPAVPSGVVTIGAIYPTSTTVSIPFSYSGSDYSGFVYSFNGGATTAWSASPLTQSGLTPLTPYTVKIAAKNSTGNGAWSTLANFTTGAAGVAPTGTVTIGTITPTSSGATIPYSYSSSDQTGFLYKLNGGSAIDAGTASPLVLPALTSSTPYTVSIAAKNAAGPGAYSTVASFTTAAFVPGALPTFGLTSAVGGTNQPFTFGHVFKKGDVPTGSYVDSDLTDWQAVPTTYWPDGSVRHAIIAGRATTTANVLKSTQLSTSGTNRGGTALTEADLAAALPATTLVCGAQTITLGALVGTAAKQRTVCSGPIMSNWLYRQVLTGTVAMEAWFDVRLYKGGVVEIFPWIENGYLIATSQTNDVRDYTLTIGGVQKFNATSLDIKHHTRIPLVTGSQFSYWTTDPQILPKHDTAYLMATKMVPNYGWTTPTSGAYAASVTETYTPNWIGDGSTAMDQTGLQRRVGVHPNNMALFLSSGADPRAYRSMVANGLASGSWPIHARDEANGFEPVVFSNRATLWQQGMPGTGGSNGNLSGINHQPQYAMIPWLVTARWFFLDEALMWVGFNYLWQAPSNRQNASGVILSYTNNETRGAAWGLMHLAQATAITPTSHPCYADMLASVNANAVAYQGRYITGTIASGAFVNSLGSLGQYSSSGNSGYGSPNGVNAWFAAPWMEYYLSMAWGEAANMDLPIASPATLLAVRDHAFKFPVGMFGDGSAGNFNWRRASAYTAPVGTDGTGWPPDVWYTNFGQVYAAYCAGYLLDDTVSAAAGQAFFDNESENVTPPNGEDFTTSFLGMGLCALAYAAEAGAPGAVAARARVESSSSWTLASNYNDLPVWGIAPR